MNKLDSAKKTKESNWSAIWILPLVALAITLWLGWQAYDNRGILIDVEFETGSGIQAGKTPLMYKGIAIGKVIDLRVDNKTRKVIASIEVEKEAAPYLGDRSLFWLVSPNVSLAGVTGLETIVSGVYISVEPIDGPLSHKFKAQDKPIGLLDNAPGLHLTLQANKLSSLAQGTPIYYRKIQVGQVKSYELSSDQKTINIKILINEPYKKLVHSNTRFWNTSGVTVSGGFSGFKVQTESLVSIIAGGISFDTEDDKIDGKPIDSTKPYKLYEDFDAARAGVNIKLKLHDFAGLTEGRTLVMSQGVQVGTLKTLKIAPDYNSATATLSMNPQVEGLLTDSAEFWVIRPSISLAGVSGLDTLLRGNYIEVQLSKKGSPTNTFTARTKAPPLNIDTPGLHLVLLSDQLSSIDVSSPILYKQMKVGSVQSYQLSKDSQRVVIGVHIEKEYAHLINSSTRFWNASGVTLKAGLSGVELKSESLQTLMMGGIAFDTPDSKGKAVVKVQAFPLYPSEDKAKLTGTLITLRLANTEGIQVGAAIKLRGLQVGVVDEVSLNNNLTGIEIVARITHRADLIARSNSKFWVVKPELGLLKTANLDTLITGAYIEVQPGTTASRVMTSFNLESDSPIMKQQEQGLRIVLSSPRRGSLKVGLPVTYREIAVGKVVDFQLSPQADRVLVGIVIEPRYAILVRQGSRFWTTSGIGIDAGLFKGVKVRTESFETMMEGGIGFATPDGSNMGSKVGANTVYILYPEPEEQWLKWAPKIPINPQ